MTPAQVNRNPQFSSLGEKESLGALLGDLAGHSAALVKNEFELAGAELQQKAGEYSKGLVVVAVASAILLLGTGALIAAAISALSYYLGITYSALLIGGVLLLAGLIALSSGVRSLKDVRPRLDQSLATLEENSQWAHSQLKQ